MRVKNLGLSHHCPILLETRKSKDITSPILVHFKVRKAVRTLARMCDVPYHRQPLTPQLRHHMVASVAQLVKAPLS